MSIDLRSSVIGLVVGLIGLCIAPEPLVALAANATEESEEESQEIMEGQKVQRERNRRRLDAVLSLGIEDDDNILNLRDDAVDAFEVDDVEPDAFLITSIDDRLLIPRARLSYSTVPANRKTSKFAVWGSAYRYQDNDIFDYERYGAYFQKDLTDTRPEIRQLELRERELQPRVFQTRRKFLKANRSRLRLGYYHIEHRYRGQRIDDDAPEQTDPRVPIRKSAFYDVDAWEVSYRQRLNRALRNRFRLDLRYLREKHDYNEEFDERDSERDRYLLGLSYFRLERSLYWEFRVAYEFSERESNTALIGRQNSVGGTINDDLASDRDTIRLNLSFNWYNERGGVPMRRSSRLRFGVAFADTENTTARENDLSHFGRSDDLFQARIDYTRPVLDDLSLSFFVRYAEVSTDFQPLPPLPDGRSRDRAVSDFDEVVFGIAINFYAGWRN